MLTGCLEYHPRLIEMARGTSSPADRRAVMAHVKGCADCARILDEQVALSAALEGMANDTLPEMAEIEARVLAEFDSAAAHEGALRRGRSRVPGIALLAAALAAVALVRVVAVERHSPAVRRAARVAVKAVQAPVTASASAAAHPAASVQRARRMVAKVRSVGARVRQATEESQPFVQIPYTVPLSPEERATVLRMEIPVAALIAAGFSTENLDPGGVVNADVLVSQDGRARAIRIDSKEEEKR